MIDLEFKIILLDFLFIYYTNKKNNTLKVLFGAPSRVRTEDLQIKSARKSLSPKY